jgi:hypothetical protein
MSDTWRAVRGRLAGACPEPKPQAMKFAHRALRCRIDSFPDGNRSRCKWECGYRWDGCTDLFPGALNVKFSVGVVGRVAEIAYQA